MDGLYEEHAPVQAAYIGAHVFNPKRRGENPDSDNYFKVLPGMLMFVDRNASDDMPKVTAHAGKLSATERTFANNLYPFGVAHDPLLDGKAAKQNTGTGDVISVIVSGCVTIYANVSGVKVGDHLFVSTSDDENSQDNGDYNGIDWYNPPKFANTPGSNYEKIGSVIEVYPKDEGVLRVLLDIEGYKPDTDTVAEFMDFGSETTGKWKADFSGSVDIAAQHPVYSQFMAAEDTSDNSKKRVIREGMTLLGANAERVVGDDNYQVVEGSFNGSSVQAIVTDTVPTHDQGDSIVGMIAGVASVCIYNSSKEIAGKFPIGCTYNGARVIARPDNWGENGNHGEHYVVLRRGGCTSASGVASLASAAGTTSTFEPAAAKSSVPAQKRRKTTSKPTRKADAKDFGI